MHRRSRATKANAGHVLAFRRSARHDRRLSVAGADRQDVHATMRAVLLVPGLLATHEVQRTDANSAAMLGLFHASRAETHKRFRKIVCLEHRQQRFLL